MLFSSKSLGVEISQSGVAFALLGGSAASPRLERVSYRPFAPGVLRVSLREQNVLDPAAFINSLKDAHNTLLYKGTRLSVTLPDTAGRIMLLDMEGRFKSRSEGLDMIRWKLKKNLPFDVADTHLDYQQLGIRDNGDMALLVVLVSRMVISQYEDLITEAGYVPARIDFNTFNLYRTFERSLSSHDIAALVSFYDTTLSIMIFTNGVPDFVRIKELSGTPAVDSRVYMEINSSFLVYRERFPDRVIQHVACIASPDIALDYCGMVTEATGYEAVLLETKSFVTPADAAPADQESLFPFTTAIGAAMRNL
jgi:type IV pilus assembly protein PilM